jgi:excinuclease ABC subunit C
MNKPLENKIKKLPAQPGIYLFYNAQKELLYVGKATTLKNRVRSYFSGTSKSIRRIEDMISEVKDIKWVIVDSVLEAIILEANYIKKYQPRYNVDGKDDKSWNYLVITNDEYPRIETVRQHEINNSKLKTQNSKFMFGPYPGIKTNEMLKILQRLFSVSYCLPNQKKPCFYRQLGQCLGVCTGEITSQEYKEKVIRPLIKFLRGNKKGLIKDLTKQMRLAGRQENFEEAGRLRDQINNLKKIQDVALLNQDFFNKKLRVADNGLSLSAGKTGFTRLEAYDISNLGESGKVGSMVAFNLIGPLKSEYRKFKIRTVVGQSDVDCLEEVIARRLKHVEWTFPDLILADGGKPQTNAVQNEIKKQGFKIPVVGIAKGVGRKKNEFIYNKKNKQLALFIKNNEQLLIQARDEAHRFAIQYQRKLRRIQD